MYDDDGFVSALNRRKLKLRIMNGFIIATVIAMIGLSVLDKVRENQQRKFCLNHGYPDVNRVTTNFTWKAQFWCVNQNKAATAESLGWK